jgi:hypothetical protein
MPVNSSLTALGSSQCQVLEGSLLPVCLSSLGISFVWRMNLSFFSVQEVRLSQNPLTDSGNGVAPRYMLIAHLGKITSLNGSQVSKQVFCMLNLCLF